jgi:hypothetical protein
VGGEELKAMYSRLAPEKTFYWVLDCPGQAEAEALLAWMRNHT